MPRAHNSRRDPFTFTAAARVLGGKAAQLRKQQLRWDDWLISTTDKFFKLRGAVRRDKFPGDFVVEMRLHEDAPCQSESRAHIHTSGQPWMHERVAWLIFEGRTTRYHTAPHRTTPHRTAQHRTAQHRTTPHAITPHHTAPQCTAPHRIT